MREWVGVLILMMHFAAFEHGLRFTYGLWHGMGYGALDDETTLRNANENENENAMYNCMSNGWVYR
jgi:hypothetical protein